MTQPLDLDAIEARAAAATRGPWGFYDGDNYADIAADLNQTSRGSYSYREKIARLEDENYWDDPAHEDDGEDRAPEQMAANAAFIAHAREDVAAMAAEIRRLRVDAAAELLPAWEAVYEPGNVSDYLIGYTNSEAAAKGAAEAWMRSQKDEVGRLEWVPEERLASGRYDAWFELVEHHDDGIPTGPGLIVRRRAAAEETHVVADDNIPTTPDTLAEWLHWRFGPHGQPWTDVADEDKACWEHQARAVRRAVARGGFKPRAPKPAVSRP